MNFDNPTPHQVRKLFRNELDYSQGLNLNGANKCWTVVVRVIVATNYQ